MADEILTDDRGRRRHRHPQPPGAAQRHEHRPARGAARVLRRAGRRPRRARRGDARRRPRVLLGHGPQGDEPRGGARGRPGERRHRGPPAGRALAPSRRSPWSTATPSRAAASWRCTAICASPPSVRALRHAAGAHRARRAVPARPEARRDHRPRVDAAAALHRPAGRRPPGLRDGHGAPGRARRRARDGDLWRSRARSPETRRCRSPA